MGRSCVAIICIDWVDMYRGCRIEYLSPVGVQVALGIGLAEVPDGKEVAANLVDVQLKLFVGSYEWYLYGKRSDNITVQARSKGFRPSLHVPFQIGSIMLQFGKILQEFMVRLPAVSDFDASCCSVVRD